MQGYSIKKMQASITVNTWGEVFDAINGIAQVDANTNNFQTQIKGMHEIVGVNEAYAICYKVACLLNMCSETRIKKDIEVKEYGDALAILFALTNTYMNNFEIENKLKEILIKYFVPKIYEMIMPGINGITFDLIKNIYMFFKSTSEYCARNQHYDLMCSLERQLNFLQDLFCDQNSKRSETIDLGLLYDVRKILISKFFDFKINENLDSCDMDCSLDYVYSLNEYEIFNQGGKLCALICNFDKVQSNQPVYKENDNLHFLYLLNLNFNFLVSKISKSLNNQTLTSQVGYIQIVNKLNELEQKIKLEFDEYIDLIKGLSKDNKGIDIIAENAVLDIKLSCLKKLSENIQMRNKMEREKCYIFQELSKLSDNLCEVEAQHKKEKQMHGQICSKKENLAKEESSLRRSVFEKRSQNENTLMEINASISKLKKKLSVLNKFQNKDDKFNEIKVQVEKKTKKIDMLNRDLMESEKFLQDASLQQKRQEKTNKRFERKLNELELKFSKLQVSNKDIKRELESLSKRTTIKVTEDQSLDVQLKVLTQKMNSRDEAYHRVRNENLQSALRSLKFKLCNIAYKSNEERQVYLNQLRLQKEQLMDLAHIEYIKNCKYLSNVQQIEGQLSCLLNLYQNSKMSSYEQQKLQSFSSLKFASKVIYLEEYERNFLRELSDEAKGIKAYFYGGMVRDRIINVQNRDLDIVLFVPENIEMELLYRLGYSHSPHKKNLYQKKVVFENQSYELDVSTYRFEDLKDFFKKPLLKVNSFLADHMGRVCDPHNAIAELTQPGVYSCLEVIGNIFERIQKDPFRILRMIGMAARLNKAIYNEHWTAFYYSGKKINKLPLGKYLVGLDKLFNHNKGDVVLGALFERADLLIEMFPFLKPVKNNLGSYKQYLMRKISEINKGTLCRQNLLSTYSNNAYLSVLLSPLFSIYSSLDNQIKSTVICQNFWGTFKGEINSKYVKQKVNENLLWYLNSVSKELLENNTKPRSYKYT